MHAFSSPTRSHHLHQGHEGRSTCGAFTPDSTRLVSCGLDGTARMWRVADGTCVRVMLGHTKYIACLVRYTYSRCSSTR